MEPRGFKQGQLIHALCTGYLCPECRRKLHLGEDAMWCKNKTCGFHGIKFALVKTHLRVKEDAGLVEC